MGFDSQVSKSSSEGFQSHIFKSGVKFKNMAGKGAIQFRILPAFNPEDVVTDDQSKERYINPMGYIPFRLQDGSLTDWGQLIYVARFVGHGSYKTGTRRDFVLPKTFATGEDAPFDPYTELQRRASSDKDWQYLTAEVKGGDGKTIETPSLSKAAKCMIANIVDLNDPDKVQVGLFSTSAYNSLCSTSHSGIACQRASNMTEEQIQNNYLTEWAVGDLTDPKSGPVLALAKGTDKGEMSGYRVSLSLDAASRVRRWPINPPELLGMRYDLADLTSIVQELSPEDIIKALVGVLNLRSPSGIHEHALLKDVFGAIYGNLIPEPPMANGASNVAQGFGNNPAKAPARTTAAGGFKPPMRKMAPMPTVDAAAIGQEEGNDEAGDLGPVEQPVASAPVSEPTTKAPPMTPGMPTAKFDRAAFMQKVQAGSKK